MSSDSFTIREAINEEYASIGELMVEVYSSLEGFPTPEEQPRYYKLLANIGMIVQKPGARLLVAASQNDQIAGAVVYFGDMQYYGSGGTATQEKNAAGFRLLSVAPNFRGNKLGKLLSQKCIELAKKSGLSQLIIHTTASMQTAWGMYERLGFQRCEDLDFDQNGLAVYGFRMKLKTDE